MEWKQVAGFQIGGTVCGKDWDLGLINATACTWCGEVRRSCPIAQGTLSRRGILWGKEHVYIQRSGSLCRQRAMEHSKSAIMKFLKMVNYPTITGSAFSREGFWVQTPGSQGKKKQNRQTAWVNLSRIPTRCYYLGCMNLFLYKQIYIFIFTYQWIFFSAPICGMQILSGQEMHPCHGCTTPGSYSELSATRGILS